MAHSRNVIAYLRKRGIPDDIIQLAIDNGYMKFSKNLNDVGSMLVTPYYLPDRYTPEIISLAAIQRIKLRPDATQWKEVNSEGKLESAKKMIGPQMSVDAKDGFKITGGNLLSNLSLARDKPFRLHIAEGFETSLSVLAAMRQPVYCTYSSNNMKSLSIDYLLSIALKAQGRGFKMDGFVLAIDNDREDKYGKRTGTEAGMGIGKQLHKAIIERDLQDKLGVFLALPKFSDWNDDYCDDREDMRKRLSSPMPMADILESNAEDFHLPSSFSPDMF